MSDLLAFEGKTNLYKFGPVLRGTVPVDLRIVGTTLRLVVKADKNAAATMFEKLYEATVAADGLFVDGVDPGNTGTIVVTPDDTTDLAATEADVVYEWELALRLPDGSQHQLDAGLFRIRPTLAGTILP